MTPALTPTQRAWRWRIFAVTWLAYAGFYFCRKNLGVTMPVLQKEYGWSNLELANVVFGYSLLYASGQFVSGMLADRFGSRFSVSLGLLIAVVSNVCMGLMPSLSALIFFACLNGAGQSGGWAGLVKIMAGCFRHSERGVVMAWWTTNYVVGGFIATIFATFVITSNWLVPSLGWRRGFWIPALVLFAITAIFFWFVRNHPRDAGVPDIIPKEEEPPSSPAQSEQVTIRETLLTYLRMMGDREVWTVAIGALFSKVTRYSFLFWLPLYLTQRLKYEPGEAGYTSSVFELAGFLGALLGGYMSDKFMQSRRLPVAALMMWGLAAACWLHPYMAAWGKLGLIISIGLIGIMNFGPDTLMQGAASQDLGGKWGVGKASGFVNGVSSVGQLVSPYLVGYISRQYGWDNLFYAFVALAFVGGTIMASRWKASNSASRQTSQ